MFTFLGDSAVKQAIFAVVEFTALVMVIARLDYRFLERQRCPSISERLSCSACCGARIISFGCQRWLQPRCHPHPSRANWQAEPDCHAHAKCYQTTKELHKIRVVCAGRCLTAMAAAIVYEQPIQYCHHSRGVSLSV